MNRWIRAKYLPGTPLGKNGLRATASREHIELSKNAAKEGMVLLKNQNAALPLKKGARIALFGKATFDYVKGGGGSGDVTVPYIRNLYEGFCEIVDGSVIFRDTIDYYREYVQAQYAAGRVPGMVAEPELPDALLNKAAAFTETAIVSISRFSGEGWDRKSELDKIPEHKGVWGPVKESNELFERGDFYFSAAERAMLEKVSARFSRTIVVLNTGGMIETAWLKENAGIDAVLLAWQGGMEGGLAAAELLMGIGNPSGKLTDTFARDLTDYPSADTFYESDEYVDYFEDIYVGYRYFETVPGAKEKVVYPFGYGLSYTKFMLLDSRVAVAADQVIASVRVLNVGNKAGREVVQAYYSAPQGKLGKPARVLAGYRKTKLLKPGEEQRMIISFPVEQMASYDDLGKVQKSAWVLEKGEYRFFIGTNVRDAAQDETTYTLEEDRVVEQLRPAMTPTSLTRRMRSDGSFEELPTSEPHDTDANALPRMDEDGMGTIFEGVVPAVRAVPSSQRFMQKPDKPQLIDVAEGRMTLDEFIAQLPNEELVHLLGGQPNTGLANTFGYGNNAAYGIPNIMTADGPAGVRFWPECGVTTTAFPCATLLGCTWDPEIVEAVGEAGGLEAKENNIFAWLTPGVNIHRNPLCGRNFEYYSEDPLLTGRQAAAMVRGIQSNHVAATPKHFALNNKETNRKNCDSRASERAIREIYLKQFEIIVKEARPWSIMSSYNIINGRRASENADLLTHILREEWGFDGVAVTDWWTCGEHYKEANAGTDIKMGCGYPDRLLKAMDVGALTRETMETAAKRILTLILRID